MIATINIDKVRKMMTGLLDAYANSRKQGLVGFSMSAGEVAGVFNLVQELDGFPKDEIEAFRLRISGIGELHRITKQNGDIR